MAGIFSRYTTSIVRAITGSTRCHLLPALAAWIHAGCSKITRSGNMVEYRLGSGSNLSRLRYGTCSSIHRIDLALLRHYTVQSTLLSPAIPNSTLHTGVTEAMTREQETFLKTVDPLHPSVESWRAPPPLRLGSTRCLNEAAYFESRRLHSAAFFIQPVEFGFFLLRN